MYKDDKQKLLKRTVMATVMGALLLATPLAGNAAGMGKITVLSALGQPLRAELDITASREELGSLAARVAPAEAFRQANVEYSGVLSTVRFVLDKHPDGKPYFKIQTDRAVNEPFIDFLVELSWSSGRLVREYAFLLDPPESNIGSGSSPAVSAPQAQPTPESTTTSAPPRDVAAEPAEMPTKPLMKTPAAATSGKPEKVDSAASGNTRTVKSGDTLGKIAAESAVGGVSLDQMLVALFNNNRDAFIGNNMNRLRAGKILTIPDADKIAAVSSGEARKIVVAQSAEFNTYRSSLATSVAKQAPMEQPSQQSSGGKIAPKIEEKAASNAGQDKLQVSRGDAAGKSGKGKAGEEDIIARDKALKEANSRIADLEKNLTDLKKLAELKSQAAVDAQKQPAASSVGTLAPTVAAVSSVPPAAVAISSTTVSPAAVALADAVVISGTAVATPAAETPKPKKKFIPPPPPEPGFIDDNPLAVYGGGAALVGLLGFFGFRNWKKKRDASGEGITVSDIAASSVFGAASSQSVDTGAASKTDFGHSTIEEIDTSKEGVDPIQEAEVYMAYGRDGQAEEILIDAMQKDPGNQAVLLKLLEIYSGRQSVPQFNTVATDLHQKTGGTGAEWEKAAAMGLALDPANLLYGGSQSDGAGSTEQTVVMEAVGDTSNEATMVMESPPVQEAPPAPVAEEAPSVMDFDLDIGGDSTPAAAVESVTPADSSAMDMDFDLDLGGESAGHSLTTTGVDLNIDAPSAGGNAIDFDIALPSSQPDSAAPLDLSAINLDLGDPTSPGAVGGDNPEVATKLELAQAYEEMGDAEGARELLHEVIAEGSHAQQEIARSKLAKLG